MTEKEESPRANAVSLDEVKKAKELEKEKEPKKIPTRSTRSISGKFICDIIRLSCYAAKATNRAHAEVGMSTVYRSLDKWHYLEYSFKDHRAVVAKYWDVKEFLEDEEYDIEELYAYLDEYVFGLENFRI